MAKLIVTIVPPTLSKEAEEQFKLWVTDHPELVARLADEAITVTHIRGCDEHGKVVGKRRYQVEVEEADAALLQFDADRPLEVVVVDSVRPADAERLFVAWWGNRPLLRQHLGEDGFIVDEHSLTESGEPVRRYRVRLSERHASLLATTSREEDVTLEAHRRAVETILTVDEIPDWVHQQLKGWLVDIQDHPDWQNGRVSVETRTFDASYIEYLREQIRLGARGEDWSNVLRARVEALESWVDKELVRVSVSRGPDHFMARLVPPGDKLIYWEVT